MTNQGLYAAANKGKSVSSAIEIDKTGLGESALYNQVVDMVKIRLETLE
jgi:hypothetical protein